MKKLFKTLSAAALVSAAATTAALGLISCTAKSTASEAPSDTAITRLAPPSDGSLPTAHTAGENLAYMAYVLDSQTQYHCYTYTVTQASIATQYTKSYKDYRDGVTISSDITYSSMVKSGSQACFVEGENGPEAYMRYSSAPSADTTNLTANWETGKPYYYDGQSYLTTYGLFQTEMTNYIINDLTITDSTPAEDNGDGTYTQSVTLDPTASTYYYQYGMKTRGGLSGFPEFQTINLDFTFDESWRVLAIDIYEVALVNKGVTVTSTSTSSASYSYDEADFEEEHFAYYDSYFKSYIGSTDLSTGGGAASLDVTSVLSNGFAGVLSGGQQFEVELLLGETLYKGYIFLGLDLADPLQTLNLKLSLGKSLEEQGLYAEYSNGEIKAYYSESFGMTANLSAVKLVIDEISEWANSLELSLSSGSDGSGGLSLPEGALDELMGAMVLTHEEGSSMANLTLAAEDILGLGVGINASLDFAVGEENSVAFASADISNLSYGGENINLALSLKTTSAPVISRPSSGMEADLSEYAADIFSLLNSDLVSVSLSLDGSSSSVKIDALKDIRVEVTALVDISGRAAGVAADITYYYNETPLSATVEAYYDMASGSYGKIILAVTSINGIKTDVRVHCDVAELSKALPALLKLANVQVDGLLAEEDTS